MNKFKIGDEVIVKLSSRYACQRHLGKQIITGEDDSQQFTYWTNERYGYNDKDLEYYKSSEEEATTKVYNIVNFCKKYYR